MRAHWINPLVKQDDYVLRGDSLHHLVNVIRIEAGDELLLLDGKGLFVETRVESISKKELRLKFVNSYVKERNFQFDLALAMPKRESLELCLKQATEIGFRNIYLIRSDYSQMRMPERDRLVKLLVSALEQSNGSFLPEFHEATWESLSWTDYEEAILLDSQNRIQTLKKIDNILAPRLLIVGPEGGFSPRELTFLHQQDRVKVVNLPTPILRTSTAVSVGAGIMIESLLK